MKIESNKNWTTCLRLNTGDGSPRVFLLNSHFLGSVPFIERVKASVSPYGRVDRYEESEVHDAPLYTKFQII